MSDAGSSPAEPPRPAVGQVEPGQGRRAPVRLGVTDLSLVVAGGTVGTGARYLVSQLVPPVGGIPVATLGTNVFGAFLLGVLLEALARGKDARRGRQVRLFAGTGVLGGFTTYSALANDTVMLGWTHPGPAVGYALGTVLVGTTASMLGIALASRLALRPDQTPPR